ncbi:putative gustatory receptor 59d [Diachasmimorpha longicaudata]|uniref:putative gustatory receptor 59d n=1 Tax=Diachasmimorpha longicaudata TaxID=58733 RepID=UPI0030B87207
MGYKEFVGLSINRYLNYYLKLLGLCPFDVDDEDVLVRSKVLTMYTCFLCMIFTFMYLHVITWRMFFMFACETPISVISDTISSTLEFLTVMAVWINGVTSQNLLRNIITSFKIVANSLQQFEGDDGYLEILRKTNFVLLLMNVVYILAGIYTDSVRSHSAIINLTIWNLFNYLRMPAHIITVVFVSTLILVKHQFRLANKSVSKVSTRINSSLKIDILCERTQCRDVEVNRLRALAQVYTDIREILKMVEIYFRAPILFFLLTHFINIASYFYVICLHLKKGSAATITPTFLIFFLWLIIHIVEVLATTEAVNSVVHQGNQTGNCFHQLINEHYPTDVVDAVKIISLRILQEPMKFSLYGLIDLNPGLLYKVCSAMTTYFVIMIQLDIQNNSDENQC